MITLVLILFQSVFHPFHVSVSDIKYKEDQKAIQISTRIFLDDLELALRAFTGNEKLDIMDEKSWNFINENLEKYLLDRMMLWDDKGREYELNYIGAEIEEDVMWCYIEIEKVKKLKQVKVWNSILHEVWGDQENLVHFRAFGDVQSARLYKGEDTEVFEWE
ncbi:DUF6702 family protein [Ekhidna sp. MALMAid0563]|uniref:DUF6702 family protein n=1 Tax=Ekhidna sp. MALMAid0563 TaxID=3143937 RepID=UPI0032DF0DF2